MLSTEHWSLLSSRTLTWNETFARSGLYLTMLSASIVALALVAQATGFDSRFVAFALVILAVDYFTGVTAILRLAQTAIEDAICLLGQNRIRHAYVELEPRLQYYLVTSIADDEEGVLTSAGLLRTKRLSFSHLLVTTPGMLAVVNSVVAASACALGAAAMHSTTWVVCGVAATVFAASLVVLWGAGQARFHRLRSSMDSRFPSAGC